MRTRRSSLVIVALSALGGLVLAAAGPVVAQQDPKQKEIDQLRQEKNELQDQNIELARRFDVEKQRLQHEKEDAMKERAGLEADKARAENERDELLREIQRLRMGAGAGVPAAGGDPLSRSVSLDLTNAPLTAAFRELGEKLGCKPELADGLPAKSTVTVRFKDLPGRIAIDLVCWNAKAAGRALDLAWRIDEGTLTVERASK
jgi:hypothetical protein